MKSFFFTSFSTPADQMNRHNPAASFGSRKKQFSEEPGRHKPDATHPSFRLSFFLFLFVTLLICSAAPLRAQVIYVNAEATDGGDGTSWSSAYNDLQDALAVAASGNEIRVAEGTYHPTDDVDRTISFEIPDGVTVLGGFQPGDDLEDRDWEANETIVSGDIGTAGNNSDNSYHVIYTENVSPSTIVDGFTITGGNADGSSGFDDSGGGWFNERSESGAASNPVIRNCTFLENRATDGGALYNYSNLNVDAGKEISPDIINSRFLENEAGEDGGAVYWFVNFENESSSKIVNTIFSGNSAGTDGGAIKIQADQNATVLPVIVNSLFSGNLAANGGAIFSTSILQGESSPEILNSVFLGNYAENNGGAIYNEENSFGNTSLTATNTIFFNNDADAEGPVFYNSEASVDIFNSSFDVPQSAANHDGSVSFTASIFETDPNFIHAPAASEAPTTDGDFHVQAGSDAIDAGFTGTDFSNFVGGPENPIDLDGNDRVYEDDGPGIIDMGVYEFEGNKYGVTCSDYNSNTVYVDLTAVGDNNGTSWDDAFTDLQDGLNLPLLCSNVSTVHVAGGTYYPDEEENIGTSFEIPDGVEMLGGFPEGGSGPGVRDWEANETILSGEIQQDDNPANNTDNVVYTRNVSSSTIVDGFTITGGNGNLGGGWYNDGSGSGNASNPTILNCTFVENRAYDGAGLYNDASDNGQSSPSIRSCNFSKNISENNGGAIFNETISGGVSSPEIIESRFLENQSEEDGGAIYNRGYEGESSPEIVNSIFAGNQAESGGAIYNSGIENGSSSPAIINSLFSGNDAMQNGGSMVNDGSRSGDSSPEIINSVFSGNHAGEEGGVIFNYILADNGNVSQTITNSIFYNNAADTDGPVFFNDSNQASVDVNNSMFDEIRSTVNHSGLVTFTDSNFESDPLFVDAPAASEAPTTDGDFQIQTGSSAINTGINSPFESGETAENVTTDLAGNPRIFDTTVDMGAYESQEETDEITCNDYTSNIAYVDHAASAGGNNGTSWDDAFTDLQDALTLPQTCSNIEMVYVAEGTYYPTDDDDRTISFEIPGGLEMLGGFPEGGGSLSSRDWQNNKTILSGDIDRDESLNNGNSYNVVRTFQFNAAIIVDGFTITSGNANFEGHDFHEDGGGWYIFNGSESNLTIRNCVFSENHARVYGGALYNVGKSSLLIVNCVFSGNHAGFGGAISNRGFDDSESSPQILNSLFSGNVADRGAGIFNDTMLPVVVNSVFSSNFTVTYGTDIHNQGTYGNSSTTVINSIFYKSSNFPFANFHSSFTTIQNSIFDRKYADLTYPSRGDDGPTIDNGNNQFSTDPLFVAPPPSSQPSTDGDFHLLPNSPAINAGDPFTDPALFSGGPDNPVDLDGNPRIFDGQTDIIDIGVYEFQENAATLELSKSFDGPATAGGTVLLEFTIANNTPQSFTDLAFTDDLDAVLSGLEATGLPNTGVCGEDSELSGTSILTFTGGILEAEESCTFDVTLQVPATAETNTYMNTTSELFIDEKPVANPAGAELTVRGPSEAEDGRVLASSQNGYVFVPTHFGQTDNDALVIIKTLPTNGHLELDGTGVSADDEIPVGDIDDGDLTYMPTAGEYGINYDTFNFKVKEPGGIESIDTYSMTIDVGTATVDLNGGEGWRFLGNPSDGDSYGDLLGPIWTKGAPGSDSPGATFPNVYTLNQANYGWEAPADLTNTTEPGQSFIVYVYSDDNNDGIPEGFPKTLISGQNWLPLDGAFSYNGLRYDESAENPDNHFLIANPHPVSLDFCEFTSTNIANSVDIWDPAANGGNGDYVNRSCGVDDVFIAPFQGFWVRTTDANPVLEIPEAAYLESAEEGYFKQSVADERSAMSQKDIADLDHSFGLMLSLHSQDGVFTNTARILFSEEGTEKLDAWDGPKLSPAGLASRWLSFYSLDEEEKAYALQNLPIDFGEKISIPLDIQTTEAGPYILTWSLPSEALAQEGYFLRDNRTGEVMELQEGAEYRFEIAPEQTSKVSETLEVLGEAISQRSDGSEARFELLIASAGIDGITELGAVPEEFTLAQNYPNPFNPTTVIRYQLPVNSEVRLEVYDMIGRRVAELVNGQIAAGRHTVNFDAGGLSSGIYLYRLQAGSQIMTRKLTVVK